MESPRLPKFHETFMPILRVLNEHGGEGLHYRKLAKLVREKYYATLPQTLLDQKTKNDTNTLSDRIGWAKSHLKIGKFLEYPARGMVRITDKGKGVLQRETFTLQDLNKDLDYVAHMEIRKTERAAKESNNEGVDVVDVDVDVDVENMDIEDSSPQDRIDSGISEIESQVKRELLEKLRDVDPFYFEKIILKLLKKMRYGEPVETPKAGDGGIDGIINEDELGFAKIYIQAKRYKEDSKVREPDIRNFIGAMEGKTRKGLFVTTSSFDGKAVDKARGASHTIKLIDGNELVDLMYEHEVGVQIRHTHKVKNIDEDFFEED